MMQSMVLMMIPAHLRQPHLFLRLSWESLIPELTRSGVSRETIQYSKPNSQWNRFWNQLKQGVPMPTDSLMLRR